MNTQDIFNELKPDIKENELVKFKTNSVLCFKCEKYNICQDNLCSFCFKNINKCRNCKNYFTPENEIYCSNCGLEMRYFGINLTIDQILNLINCPFKSQQMNNNIINIYDYYKQINNRKHKILKSKNEFKLLMNLCKDKSSGEVYCILDGFRDFNSVLLSAKYADKLLIQFNEKTNTNSYYRYIHAIAPFIFDIWNTNNKNNVFLCYFKDFGALTSCPNSDKKLFELWNRCININCSGTFSDCVIQKCEICNKPIYISEKKIRCLKCYNYLHFDCCNSYLLTSGQYIFKDGIKKKISSCKICKEKWPIFKISNTNYGAFIIN